MLNTTIVIYLLPNAIASTAPRRNHEPSISSLYVLFNKLGTLSKMNLFVRSNFSFLLKRRVIKASEYRNVIPMCTTRAFRARETPRFSPRNVKRKRTSFDKIVTKIDIDATLRSILWSSVVGISGVTTSAYPASTANGRKFRWSHAVRCERNPIHDRIGMRPKRESSILMDCAFPSAQRPFCFRYAPMSYGIRP